MNKVLLMAVLALIIVSGCSIKQNSNDSVRYLYTVQIKDKTYGFTDTEVPKEQIGEKIGNAPITCSVSDCALPPGHIFYKIKGSERKKYVAVLSNVDEKHYRWTNIK